MRGGRGEGRLALDNEIVTRSFLLVKQGRYRRRVERGVKLSDNEAKKKEASDVTQGTRQYANPEHCARARARSTGEMSWHSSPNGQCTASPHCALCQPHCAAVPSAGTARLLASSPSAVLGNFCLAVHRLQERKSGPMLWYDAHLVVIKGGDSCGDSCDLRCRTAVRACGRAGPRAHAAAKPRLLLIVASKHNHVSPTRVSHMYMRVAALHSTHMETNGQHVSV